MQILRVLSANTHRHFDYKQTKSDSQSKKKSQETWHTAIAMQDNHIQTDRLDSERRSIAQIGSAAIAVRRHFISIVKFHIY